MTWNWQLGDWPDFSYDSAQLADLEAQFLLKSGSLLGATKYLGRDAGGEQLKVDFLAEEALKTSKIEGEILNRNSVRSSVEHQLGLKTKHTNVTPAEQGISEMMVDLHRSFAGPLSREKLFAWHTMLAKHRTDLKDIGAYRSHASPMRVVSGPVHKQKIHFEAPPSKKVPAEMARFVSWFNGSKLPPLARSGLAHLYFVSIHPFEDGNGRIGRAVAEKALFQGVGEPLLLALSRTIEKQRRNYYRFLEISNKSNEITPWLVYFSKTVLEALDDSHATIDFTIKKAKLYDRVGATLNTRQEKVLARILREGPSGFEGDLSAEKYIAITHTSRATATRDLQELVLADVLIRRGERKATRYRLNLG